MTPADILRGARKLLEPEGAWTQGCKARTKRGNRVLSHSPLAVSFSMVGAITHIAGDLDFLTAEDLVWALIRATTPVESLAVWNDHPDRTHAEVLAAFDRAIEIVEGEQ